MMFQLEEERKVTANLSRTLELEKRKVTISFAIIGKYMRDGWMTMVMMMMRMMIMALMMIMAFMMMNVLMMASVKVESLEQKAKCGSSKMSQSSRGERRRSSLLPEEVTTSFKRCYFIFARKIFVLQYFQKCIVKRFGNVRPACPRAWKFTASAATTWG